MSNEIEAIWLHVYIPHLKPLLVGCCYRPPNTNSSYLDKLCDMIDKVGDFTNEMFLLGDLNINWNTIDCPLIFFFSSTDACGLTQVVTEPTRVCVKRDGSRTSTCIDHIFTNTAELCTKGMCILVGCSDHSLVAILRKTKVPKAGPKIILKRSYKHFKEDHFIEDVRNICWDSVLKKSEPDEAVENFNKLFEEIIDKHTPVRKRSIRSVRSPRIDNELKECMEHRDNAKKMAIRFNYESDWQVYCKLRNYATR